MNCPYIQEIYIVCVLRRWIQVLSCEREDWISVLTKTHGNDSVKPLNMGERPPQSAGQAFARAREIVYNGVFFG